MASRSQFEGFAVPRSTLERFIYNACDPASNLEPNLALNLEIVDMINQKKANAPREAAVTIVHLINHRNPNVSLLALSLLDNCVKNCGYPFHLQISTKDFLNELVRRFPERPPMRPSRVMNRVLELIEEWRQTICQTSKYKDDLGFIRDMHRLLLYKGYMFPEVRREDAAVLNPSDNLKSAEEMEEEERAAQSAKLQELIRRGTPADLQEANRLMKVMAGYDTRHKTDYRAKAAEEVARIQQKARLLEEMLQNQKAGDKIGNDDVFEELAGALQSAHPKIQRMCEEESSDTEAVAKLLEINDSIHRTIERYKLMKAGNVEAANQIPKGTLGTTTGVSKNAANELSLIDFDPETPVQAQQAVPASNGSLLEDVQAPSSSSVQQASDDLLGLSINDPVPNQPGSITLGGGSGMGGFGFPQPATSTPHTRPSATIPSPPQQQQSPKPNYNAFASITSSLSSSKPAMPMPGFTVSQPPHQPQPQAQTHVDPFASLVSSSSRPGTPSRQRNGIPSASNQGASLLDLASAQPPPPTSAAASTAADDEWTFESSLPDQPSSHTIQVHSSTIQITFTSSRPPSTTADPSPINISATFSNLAPQPVSGLHFQIAVEKAYAIQLRPQSGRDMPPNGRDAIKQDVLLTGVPVGKGSGVKMRWRVSYMLGQENREEQGVVPSLGIQ